MYFIYDLETSGLPQFNSYRGFYYPSYIDKYDTARVVSISWILLNNELDIIDKQTHLVKPDGFIIPEQTIKIHHITNEMAHEQGIPISNLFDILKTILPQVTTLVAHNVKFDYNVLCSECYRYGENELARMLEQCNKYCTMASGKNLLGLTKNPKLSLLYEILYNEETTNAHDAEYDTLYCYKCFVMLKYIPHRQPYTQTPYYNKYPNKQRRLS